MSALLYALLHFQGHLTLDNLEHFRQMGSPTQGHPVRGFAPGIETSTGPLGQGFGNGVGMALAEAYLRTVYGKEVVDHQTFVLATDGDIQEGVCREAAALAAHLKLGRLTVFYDSNHIQLASPTSATMSEDTAAAFRAYGWHVLELSDGNDHASLIKAIEDAQQYEAKPTLIVGNTVIARDTTKAGTVETHGAPLGQPVIDEFKARKKHPGTAFWVPPAVVELYRAQMRASQKAEEDWNQRLAAFRKAKPELAAAWALSHGEVQPGQIRAKLHEAARAIAIKDKPAATRVSAGEAMAAFKDAVPHLFGGSADLANSTRTDFFEKAVGYYPEALKAGEFKGRGIHFGVREHGMGTMANGIAAHGGLLPFTGTFLAFSDYMRGSLRLAAISHLPVTFIFTHDSFFLGEDGETHQPVEQTAALRLIPRMAVLRPADAHECVATWTWVLEQAMGAHPRPVCLVLSRQNVPVLAGARTRAMDGVPRGAYVVSEDASAADIQVIATGSEVGLALEAAKLLQEKHGKRARVISMPSMELFREQTQEYRDSVLLPSIPLRMSLEAGTPLGWKEWTGDLGFEYGLDTFGESAPAEALAEKFGFTPAAVADRMHRLVAEFPARFAAGVYRGADALSGVAPANLPTDIRALVEARKK